MLNNYKKSKKIKNRNHSPKNSSDKLYLALDLPTAMLQSDPENSEQE